MIDDRACKLRPYAIPKGHEATIAPQAARGAHQAAVVAATAVELDLDLRLNDVHRVDRHLHRAG